MVLCKANHVDSFENAVTRVTSQIGGELVDSLLRVHIESVTLFKRREPSSSIISVFVSVP